jgi:hypothetical protein
VPVASDVALDEACAVRAESYGHHLPALRRDYAEPDELDRTGSASTFLALDKASGAAVGSVRVQLGGVGRKLLLEGSYAAPEWLALLPRAELTRMSVVAGADPLVRLLLWKAGLFYCLANQIRCMVIGARKPALIRQYQALGFERLSTEAVPFVHAGNLPHHVLWFDVTTLERRWHAARHRLYGFMFGTHHPDLDLFGPRWKPGVRSPLPGDYQPAARWGGPGSAPMWLSSQRTSIECRSLDTKGLTRKSSMPAAAQATLEVPDSLAVTAITGTRESPSAAS